MEEDRLTYWTRYPDLETGPLWVGLHLHRRAGATVLVGLETWTEAPGRARRSLGPEAPDNDELQLWPPRPLHLADLRRLRFRELLDQLFAALRDRDLAVNWRPARPGRPKVYDDAHYERVAGIYLRARASKSPPVQAVQATWNVSRGTAAGWVAKARAAGWL
jgi:hypothetical protein